MANSARMLAQAARKAGFKPLVIDLFGDLDTRLSSEDIQQIPSLAEVHLLPAIANFVKRYPVTCGFYGSGFEPYLDSLRSLGSRMTLLGNQPDVFAIVQDKPAFFSLLQRLQIPYPDVSFCLPDQLEGWLIKPMQGEGGVGIKKSRVDSGANPSVYWQIYQQGTPHSVLFLADGNGSQIVGFNRQWTTTLSDKDEFIFSGIINHTALSHEQKTRISDWLNLLVPELCLKGLNSLDFIQSENASYVLEINPRPPASMQLYDADLFVRHIKACEGELIGYEIGQDDFTAYQIVYAVRNIRIPSGFKWPTYVADIPVADSIINKAQPICSMIVRGKEPDKVLEQLQISQELIINQLDRFQIHGI